MHVQSDHFKWTCANVLIGSGDPYSTAGAKCFEEAAKKRQINVCRKVNYVSGSKDMKTSIEELVAKSCCRVTVGFGQSQDLPPLFLEAHKQNYEGEWIVGETVVAAVDGIVAELKTHLPEASVHKLLQGIDTFTFGHSRLCRRNIRACQE